MDSTAQKIENKIRKFRRGRIFFPDDFVNIGTSDTIRQTLNRLTKSGIIIRVAQGVYCYPEIDKKLGLGVIYPSYDQIAEALANRDHARIIPTGEYALNALGLSTQVPMNYVYLTDGQSRKVCVAGNRGIQFKNTAPRNLAFKNRLAMLVNSALKSIKRENITSNQVSHIITLLRNENKNSVLSDLKLMPVWVRKIVTEAYAQ